MKPKNYEVGERGPKERDLSPVDEWIGSRLKMRRVMLRMSQEDLSSMIGVTFQQVQKYESGANRISASRLYAISKVLQVEVGFFFEGLEKSFPELARMFAEEFGIDMVEEEATPFDPMHDMETLRLVNAYWKLSDPDKRRHVLEFIVSMAGSE